MPYEPLLAQEAGTLGIAVRHSRFPIRDGGVPEPAGMVAILDAIDAALADGQGLYLHCWGGIGRTGTVLGCYLVRHGLTGEAALREIARLRREVPDAWRSSPETAAQFTMIDHWLIGA